MRSIAEFLNNTSQSRPFIHDDVISEDDRKALETVRKVRLFAEKAVTTAVSLQAMRLTSLSTSRSSDPWGTDTQDTVMTMSPGRNQKRKLREAQNELWENRNILTRLKSFGLIYEGAVVIQKRALDLKNELAIDHNVTFYDKEKFDMKEELADLLILRRDKNSTDEAQSILKKILQENPTNQEDENGGHSLRFASTSTPSYQRNLRLQYKLGQLWKERGQLDKAKNSLRIVFEAYTDENPKDIEKIKQVGEQLLELYDLRVQRGALELREVFLSQLLGVRSELEKVTGRPLEHRSQCDDALQWCRDKGIQVPEPSPDYRFDMIDDDGSSPLHCAALKCRKESVIIQMLEHTDTLENRDSDSDTPLLSAVGSSNVAALRLLLLKGGSLNARDNKRQTPSTEVKRQR